MTVNEYFTQHRKRHHGIMRAPYMVCVDDFQMSVQASAIHYCRPRNDEGPYTHVEVGFPSQAEPLLAPYDDGGSGVYCAVPVEVVEQIVANHGGLV